MRYSAIAKEIDFEPLPKEIERFLVKIQYNPDTGCWEWTGAKCVEGYGQVKCRGNHYKAHRLAYAIFRRPLLRMLDVHHKCRNIACVNPWHLELMTNKENNDIKNGESDDCPF